MVEQDPEMTDSPKDSSILGVVLMVLITVIIAAGIAAVIITTGGL